MTASAEIVTRHWSHRSSCPLAHCCGATGAPSCFVLTPGTATVRMVPVDVEALGEDRAAVAGALERGDRVVISGYEDLVDGDAVERVPRGGPGPVIEPAVPVIDVHDVTRTYHLGGGRCRRARPARGLLRRRARGDGGHRRPERLGQVDPAAPARRAGPPDGGNGALLRVAMSRTSDGELAALRNAEIGFVFQQFQLLARTSAIANVALPLVYAGVPSGAQGARAGGTGVRGLEHRLEHRPAQLSGGEQQRVAIAGRSSPHRGSSSPTSRPATSTRPPGTRS
jgi:energy-coupling factor transporter ATP-binding protein EcfA2